MGVKRPHRLVDTFPGGPKWPFSGPPPRPCLSGAQLDSSEPENCFPLSACKRCTDVELLRRRVHGNWDREAPERQRVAPLSHDISATSVAALNCNSHERLQPRPIRSLDWPQVGQPNLGRPALTLERAAQADANKRRAGRLDWKHFRLHQSASLRPEKEREICRPLGVDKRNCSCSSAPARPLWSRTPPIGPKQASKRGRDDY